MGNKIHNFLRDLSDNSKAVKDLYLGYRKLQWSLKGIVVDYNHKKRADGKIDERYIKLKDYKNIHNGKRCFIIATGPSLTMEDIEKLKDEYTFSMNSICKLYDKTEWRPTYFAIQDREVFSSLENIIRKHKEIPVFIADNIEWKNKREPEWINFPFDSMYHAYDIQIGKYHAKFSDDAYSIVYDGYSIAYSCVELAVYMGFKEIYLLGTDCTYMGPKEHFIDSGVEDRSRKFATPKLVTAYEAAKEYADKHNIKIYNATRGGVLEVFPRVDLDEVLKK